MVTWLLVVGCHEPERSAAVRAPTDTDTDTAATSTASAPADPCETVLVPGAFGATSDALPDPDAPTFGAAPEPFQVRLGWPTEDPSRSAGFLWRTDTDTLASTVQYGVGDALDQTAVGVSYRFGGAGDDPGPDRIHEVRLCSGLQPATTYSYRVGGDGHWSPTYQFTTPGAPGSFDTFRVAVLGDARGAYETWGSLLAAIDAEDPDLILFTGDMVDLGGVQAQWDAWFDAAGDILARRPLLGAHGNHEFLAPHYFAQFMFPGNEQWYAVRYGPLELVVLNDTLAALTDLQTEATFQQDVFGATDAPWRVAMHHQAAYSACTRHGSNQLVRDAWAPVWDDAGVQLVLAGHNHIYERSVPIRDDAPAPDGAGAVYLVCGGAGADLYDEVDDTAWWNAAAVSAQHYAIGDFGPDVATFEVKDLAGTTIDRFSILRGPDAQR
ncbi:MAG: metallophosphoesterase family protein [Myxococcota bacterium]